MLYIFDWDGTISDSASKIIRCMQLAAEDSGLPVLDDHLIRDIIGLGLPEAIERLYPEVEAHFHERLRDHYAAHFIREDTQPSAFFPGVLATLQHLHAAGHYLAVATGKSRKGLDRVLQNLDLEDFFHASRCADETASKPDPLMLQELLDEFALSVDDAVMIGDTEFDMAMAERIGMRKIAVSYGAHPVSRLQKYSPVLCVDDFCEILRFAGNDQT